MSFEADVREEFTAAFLDPWSPVPMPAFLGTSPRTEASVPDPRKDVARLLDVLVARFPVARRLTGEETFAAVARQFIVFEPPLAASLVYYGDAFPRFLRKFGNTPSIEYLADIAALEMTRGKAYRARGATPLSVQLLSSMTARQFNALKLDLNPSVFLIKSRFPIVTIWEANQSDRDCTIQRWVPESVLVARPFRHVEVQRLPAGGHAFLNAISNGATLAVAINAAAREPEFDIGINLTMLIESNIVVGLHLAR